MTLIQLFKGSKLKLERVEDEDMDLHRIYLKKQGSTDTVKYAHRGVIFSEGDDLFWLDIKGYNFLYVSTPEKEEYIYYFPFREGVIEPLGKVKESFIYGIDVTEKKYCFEIKVNILGEMYINYITTEPKGCDVGLKGLFEILYVLLFTLGYKGKVSLKDDVQIGGKFITYERILEGKPSIYEKYGFRIIPERARDIEKARQTKDFKTLRLLCSNIPMVAKDISGFV